MTNKNIKETLIIYLWILPALLFLFFFLVKPVFETIALSFTREIKVSDQLINKEILYYLVIENKKEINSDDIFINLKGIDNVINKINKKYNLTLNLNNFGKLLTVKEAIEVIILNIYDKLEKEGDIKKFVWFENYQKIFKDKNMLFAFKNNILWLVLFTFFTIILGLIIAKLIDKIKWAIIAKSIIFIPMAVSYVASGVIWSFMYSKDINIGTVNAFFNLIGNTLKIFGFNGYSATAFLGKPETVNFALIIAGIWIWCGFCIVVFTAAFNGIPNDIIESSKIDGANALQTFLKIEIPYIMPTIVVVTTAMMINVLKIFDIVYTMTGGGPFGSSEVIANRMYRTAFNDNNMEYASAMAVILFLAVIPVMIINIKNILNEEKY